MFCPFCGKQLPDAARFCGGCGQALPQRQTPTPPPAESKPPVTPQPPVSHTPQNDAARLFEKPQRTAPPVKKKKSPVGKILLIVLPLVVILGGVAFGLFWGTQTNRYKAAQRALDNKEYEAALTGFAALGTFRNSDMIVEELQRQQADYDKAEALLAEKQYDKAADAFAKLGGYRDSVFREEEIRADQKAYAHALELLERGDVDTAATAFTALGDFADSEAQLAVLMELNAAYEHARQLEREGDYEGAAAAYAALGEYRDAPILATTTEENGKAYAQAHALLAAGDYAGAELAFAALGRFADSEELAQELQEQRETYTQAQNDEKAGNMRAALDAYLLLGDYQDAPARVEALAPHADEYDAAMELLRAGSYEAAGNAFNGLAGYVDSLDRRDECWYKQAMSCFDREMWDEGLEYGGRMQKKNYDAFVNDYHEKYCADAPSMEALADVMAARFDLEDRTSSSVSDCYGDWVQMEYDALEEYRSMHFDDEYLEEHFLGYMTGLDWQAAALGSSGTIADEDLWKKGLSKCYEEAALIDNAYKMFKVHQPGLGDRLEQRQAALLVDVDEVLLDMIMEQLRNKDPYAANKNGESYYITNTSQYTFTVTLEFYFYSGSKLVGTTTSETYTLVPGEVWPLHIPFPNVYFDGSISIQATFMDIH